MKKLCYAAFCMLSVSFLITSCSDGTIGDTFAEDHYQESGGTIINYSNVVNGFFDVGDPDNSSIGFDLTDYTGADPSGVTIVASYGGNEVVLAQGSTDFPSSYTVTMNEFLTALSVPFDSVSVGDNGAIFFDATNGSGTFRSSNALVVPFSCRSELAGTYDYSTTNIWCGEADVTGTVEILEISSGVYTFDDWSFGGYPACYGGTAANWGTLSVNDVCNVISVAGADNYGDAWDIKVDSVNGSDLTISWSNTYGEAGTTTITRTDGSDWPPLTN